jgi:hypothetical protein
MIDSLTMIRFITMIVSGCIISYNFYGSNPILAYQIIAFCVAHLVAPISAVNNLKKKNLGAILKGTRMGARSNFYTEHLPYTYASGEHARTHTHHEISHCANILGVRSWQ